MDHVVQRVLHGRLGRLTIVASRPEDLPSRGVEGVNLGAVGGGHEEPAAIEEARIQIAVPVGGQADEVSAADPRIKAQPVDAAVLDARDATAPRFVFT